MGCLLGVFWKKWWCIGERHIFSIKTMCVLYLHISPLEVVVVPVYHPLGSWQYLLTIEFGKHIMGLYWLRNIKLIVTTIEKNMSIYFLDRMCDIIIALLNLTHCGLVTSCGIIKLGSTLIQVMVCCAWRHQAVTWINVDYLWKSSIQNCCHISQGLKTQSWHCRYKSLIHAELHLIIWVPAFGLAPNGVGPLAAGLVPNAS